MRGYALDAVERQSRTGADRPLRSETARTILHAALGAPRTEHRAVGLGTAVRAQTSRLTASGLTCDGELVQLSAFPRDRAATDPVSRIRRPSRRR